ncbi:MAG: aminotransferase class I/II-fold pyridoxal phosphate-dependent enzyme [Acidimicrobiia bacterium]|nr:aminotransferase class I/II-fold pyridoxal phosphate-dependent enzyme [Acidimicrobiia bacterium]
MKATARTISGMRRSGIREIMDLAAQDRDVLRLEVGDPNFPTPTHIIEAAAQAAADGFTKYTANRGIPSVRETLATKIAMQNGFEVGIDQLVVTTGAVTALLQSLMVLCDPGDVVLLPDLAWPNYEMMTTVIDAPVRRYPLDPARGFLPDLDALDRICRDTPLAKALVINSPANPTGGVFDRPTVEGLIDIANRYDLYLVSDEAYEDIIFEGGHISPASLNGSGRVISVFTVSKSYAMTGWRIGYVAASQEVAALISKLQEAMTSCATAVAQKAAQAAIGGDQACVAEMRDAYRQRRDMTTDLLAEEGLLITKPHGAFYVLADTSPTGLDGYEFCRKLIVQRGVALAPGETFGSTGSGKVRISLATAPADLEEGVRRFCAAVRDWS